jgi:hypothetical protein
MTRHTTVSAVTALAGLVAAATALAAAGQQYNGPAGSSPNAGVEFNARLAKGRPTQVRRFEFHNIPAQCAGYGPTAVTEQLSITMKVTGKRTFTGTGSANSGRVTAKVSGRFSRSFGRATGTLRVAGTVPGCRTADTGMVRWTAAKVR